MTIFRVYCSYVDRASSVHITATHTTKAKTPEDAQKMARAHFRDVADEGIVVINKTKIARNGK